MCEELQKQLLEVETELHKREEEVALLKTNSDRASTFETREKEDMAEALETLRDQFSKCKIQLSFAEKELNAFKVSVAIIISNLDRYLTRYYFTLGS